MIWPNRCSRRKKKRRRKSPKPAKQRGGKTKTPPKGKAAAGNLAVKSIAISHPDRVIYPKPQITKGDLAQYYAEVAPVMMPHLKNRPLSALRCPEGVAETCFYQRHIGMGDNPHLHDVNVSVNGKKQPYMMIADEKGLISLAQWGVIEMHPWQCTANHLDKPDRMIFDLDPGPAVKWQALIDAAREVQTRMNELGLESFLKTTGGKGPACRRAAGAVARLVAGEGIHAGDCRIDGER